MAEEDFGRGVVSLPPNPFKIEIAKNDVMGGYDVLLQVGGMKVSHTR